MSAKMGQIVGPSSGLVGAGGSTAVPEVPSEESGPTAVLQEAVGRWLRRCALGGKGGDPLCPGAGGRLKTVPPQ